MHQKLYNSRMVLCAADAPVKTNGYVDEKVEVETRSTTSGASFDSETSLCHVPEAYPEACRQNMKFQTEIVRDFVLSPDLAAQWSKFQDTLKENPEYVEAVQVDLPNVQPKVVNVKITPEEAAELRREMDAVAPLCKALCEAQGYHGYSTLDPAFALGGLFHPTLGKLLAKNRDLIEAVNPEVTAVSLNTFRHIAGVPIGDSDGIHCTYSSMPFSADVCKSEEFPNQINIHLALTPVTLESKPFCVWMGGKRERRTPTHAYRYLLEEGYWKEHGLEEIAQKALFLATATHFTGKADRRLAAIGANFFNVHTWSHRYLRDPAKHLQAYYAPIDVGEALMFDAFQQHAGIIRDCEENRYSVVFRSSGTAAEGADVFTNHPQLYTTDEEKKGMEKCAEVIEIIFGYKEKGLTLRDVLYEAPENGEYNPDYTSYTFDKVPGSCSVQGLLRHYEIAEQFFRNPCIPQEAIDLIKKEHL